MSFYFLKPEHTQLKLDNYQSTRLIEEQKKRHNEILHTQACQSEIVILKLDVLAQIQEIFRITRENDKEELENLSNTQDTYISPSQKKNRKERKTDLSKNQENLNSAVTELINLLNAEVTYDEGSKQFKISFKKQYKVFFGQKEEEACIFINLQQSRTDPWGKLLSMIRWNLISYSISTLTQRRNFENKVINIFKLKLQEKLPAEFKNNKNISVKLELNINDPTPNSIPAQQLYNRNI